MNNSLVALNQTHLENIILLYSSNLENVPQKSGVKICELPLPHTVDKIGWNTCINTLHHFLRTLTFEASWSAKADAFFVAFFSRHCAQHWRSQKKRTKHGFEGYCLAIYLRYRWREFMSLSSVRRSWVFIEKSLVKSWLFLFLDFCSHMEQQSYDLYFPCHPRWLTEKKKKVMIIGVLQVYRKNMAGFVA